MALQWNQQTWFNFPPSLDPVYQFYGNNGAVTARRFVPWPMGTPPSVPPATPTAGPRNLSQILRATIAVLTIILIGLLITSSLLFALSPSEGGSVQATALTPAEGDPVQSTAEWNSWSPWTTCTTTCNGGIRYRTRQCLDTVSTMASTDCEGTSRESDICNIQQCRQPKHFGTSQTLSGDFDGIYVGIKGKLTTIATWGDWNAYGQCSSTCGNGQETRTRMCDVAGTTGAECDGPTPVEARLCNSGQCPIWGAWGEYSSCSVTCGAGMQIRTRECSDLDSTGGSCEGQPPSSSQQCNDEPCPLPTVASGSLSLDRSFTDALSDPSTQEYQQLKMDVEQQVTGVLMGEFGSNLQALEVTGFRINGAGNVVVDFSAKVNADTTTPGEIDVAGKIKTTLEEAADTSSIGSLTVTGVDVSAQSGTSVTVSSAITLDREYTDDLSDATSQLYRQLKMDVEEQVSTVLSREFGESLQSVEVKGFRPGSVIADIHVVIMSNGEMGQIDVATQQVEGSIQRAATNDEFGSLSVTDVEAQPQKETLKPNILNTPEHIVQSTDANSATATIAWTPPTASDNSGVVTLSSSHESGGKFPIGSTTVTFTAIDSSFNVMTSSFIVTVTDEEAPVVSAISNQNVNTDTGSPTAKVSWPQPTAIDNSGDDVTLTSDGDHNPGDLFPIGTTTVTYVAVDSSGNEATLQFVVIVTDVELPVIAGNPGNQVVSTSSCTGSIDAVVSWTPPTATDNSGREVTLSSNYEPGDTFPIDSTDVIYTADDGNGNTATLQFTVTVVDSSTSCNEQLSGTDPCPLTLRAYSQSGFDSGVMLQPGEDWNASEQDAALSIELHKSATITSVLVTNADVDVSFTVFYHIVGSPIRQFILDDNEEVTIFVGSSDSTTTQLPVLDGPIDSFEIFILQGGGRPITTAFFGCYID